MIRWPCFGSRPVVSVSIRSWRMRRNENSRSRTEKAASDCDRQPRRIVTRDRALRQCAHRKALRPLAEPYCDVRPREARADATFSDAYTTLHTRHRVKRPTLLAIFLD